jgi:hypothetical protein
MRMIEPPTPSEAIPVPACCRARPLKPSQLTLGGPFPAHEVLPGRHRRRLAATSDRSARLLLPSSYPLKAGAHRGHEAVTHTAEPVQLGVERGWILRIERLPDADAEPWGVRRPVDVSRCSCRRPKSASWPIASPLCKAQGGSPATAVASGRGGPTMRKGQRRMSGPRRPAIGMCHVSGLCRRAVGLDRSP